MSWQEALRKLICFPLQLSCFLVTAWDVFAEFDEKTIWEYPVEFTNVSVFQPVQVERTEKVILGVLFDYKNHFSVYSQLCPSMLVYWKDHLPFMKGS